MFGSNHFKDLSPAEFRASYLNGYAGPTADGKTKYGKTRSQSRRATESSGTVMGKHIPVNHHPDVHRRILEERSKYSKIDFYFDGPNCEWYDMSCLMQWLMHTYVYYGIGTMEPAYDSESYPTCKFHFSFENLLFSSSI